MTTGKIGVIAAFPMEIAPLVRGWRGQRLDFSDRAWFGSIGLGEHDVEAVAVAAGMGAASAHRACELACSLGGAVERLVSVGFAGALSCGLQPGAAYRVDKVIDAGTGQAFGSQAGAIPALTLVTVDRVAGPERKIELRNRYQAVMVDMEAAAVAKFALDRSLGFECIKAITDPMEARLPDFSRYADAHGKLGWGRTALALAFSPRYWPAMAGMASKVRGGSAAIARKIEELAGGPAESDL